MTRQPTPALQPEPPADWKIAHKFNGEPGPEWEYLPDKKPPGLVRRYFTTQRHLSGLVMGGVIAYVRAKKQSEEPGRGLVFFLLRILAVFFYPLVNRKLAKEPFPIQLRRRLEILGPTYIKLGQVLSLREDILPREITQELKNLLDRLPIVSYDRYVELLGKGLGRPANESYQWVARSPIGSASIAQTHLAVTKEGDHVIIKLVKPGIRETLRRDSVLIGWFGHFLELIVPQYQPSRVLDEFTEYTFREVDLRREANNAETFTANFRDMEGVRFPHIYRRYCSASVLTMEFFEGVKPDGEAAQELTEPQRDRLIDKGAGAIIRMLYRDGFFHADLHPGNLLILDGKDCGFIDLGMVGRFDEGLRRTLMYYYYCLVTGDAGNAARYLASVATPAKGGDPKGFQREVEDISLRWQRAGSSFEDFSLAQLIMESVSMGGRYRMYFPMEMVLMVKALVTFEGVGNLLKPGFDVAEVSKRHISKLFVGQFNPYALLKESLRGAPEVVDALVQAPLLITEGLKLLEKTAKEPANNPLENIRATMFSGFCLLGGVILIAFEGPWPLATLLFGVTIAVTFKKGI